MKKQEATKITPDELAAIAREVNYNPETGVFTSVRSRGNVRAGKILGLPGDHGYLRLEVLKKKFYAHRLAFALVHGYLPEIVDHINGDRQDNRSENLREADYVINARNAAVKITSRSKFRGVSAERSGKWKVWIRSSGKHINIGSFSRQEEAAFRYDMASIEIHGEHGRRNFLPLMA